MFGRTPARLAVAAMIAMVAGTGESAARQADNGSQPAGAVPTAEAAPSSAPKVSEFDAWRDRFRARALKAGIPHDVFAAALGNVRPDEKVHEKDADQPEFNRPIWEYLDGALSSTRIRNGRKMMQRHAGLLARAEQKYGVPRRFLVAIWGMETSYGALLGNHDLFQALATLSYKGDRTDYGEEQLIAALKLLAKGEKPLEQMKGSWAGAVGHTQFVPTTYLQYAVDGDSDGKRDLWDSLSDVFQSTANYLKASGFDPNLKWGREAFLPDDFDYALAGYHEKKPLSEWRALGIKMANGALVPALDIEASVLVPAGHQGPAFLVYENFHAILDYNHSTSYALAIGLLSDRITDGPSLKTPWPRHHKPLALRERIEIQQRLTALGYAPGTADGVLGRETRKAIRAFQKDQGDIADGYATSDLLARLRTAKPRAADEIAAAATDETAGTAGQETVLAEARDSEADAAQPVPADERTEQPIPVTGTAVDARAETGESAGQETAVAEAEDGSAQPIPVASRGEEPTETAAAGTDEDTAAPAGAETEGAGAYTGAPSEDTDLAAAAASEENEALSEAGTDGAFLAQLPGGTPTPRSKEEALGESAGVAGVAVVATPAAMPRAKPAVNEVTAPPVYSRGRPASATPARSSGVTAALAAPGLVILGNGVAAPVRANQEAMPTAAAAAGDPSDTGTVAIPVNGDADPIISPPGTAYVGTSDQPDETADEENAPAAGEESENGEDAPSPPSSGS